MKTEYLGWIVAIGIGVVFLLPSSQKENRPKPIPKPDIEEVEEVELSKNAKLGKKTAEAIIKGYVQAFKDLKEEDLDDGDEFTKKLSELTAAMLVEACDPFDKAMQKLVESETFDEKKGAKFCNDMITGFSTLIKVEPMESSAVCQCGSLSFLSSTGHESCTCEEGKCRCNDCRCLTCNGKVK